MRNNPYKATSGIERLKKALGYSLQGLAFAWKGEAAFRQEVWLFLILLPLALFVGETALERAVLIAVLLLVLLVELLNSAIEAVVDRISLEPHALAKRAKDMGSAAVFIAILNAAIVWGLILLD